MAHGTPQVGAFVWYGPINTVYLWNVDTVHYRGFQNHHTRHGLFFLPRRCGSMRFFLVRQKSGSKCGHVTTKYEALQYCSSNKRQAATKQEARDKPSLVSILLHRVSINTSIHPYLAIKSINQSFILTNCLHIGHSSWETRLIPSVLRHFHALVNFFKSNTLSMP
jgi:hypothetical protein